MKENPKFTSWSGKWKDQRDNVDAEKILALWQQPLPRGWERKLWKGKVNYRKRSHDKGEQRIEKELFDGGSEGFNLVFEGEQTNAHWRMEAIYQNMPLANQRKGQVIADAFGVLETGEVARPLFVEVKVTDNNPWYALVENLQQLRLARACARNIQEFLHAKTEHRVERGIWGLILAPENYYEKHAGNLAKCKPLLAALKQNTRARVAFGVSDRLGSGLIRIIASNWLS